MTTTNQLGTQTAMLLNALYQIGADTRRKIIESCCPRDEDKDADDIREKMLAIAEDLEKYFHVPGTGGRKFRELCEVTGTWAWYDPTKQVNVDVRDVQPPLDLLANTPILDRED